jgi:uncharacterized integral membrane protein
MNHKRSSVLILAGYIKLFVLALLTLMVILLAIQNHDTLAQEISLKLNLFLWTGATAPYPLYILVVLAFLLGVFLTSLAGIASRFYLRRDLKEAMLLNEAAEKEILTLRGQALNISTHKDASGAS